MTFSDPPFPLAQLTEFEVGETLGINTSVDEDDTYYKSNHAFIEVHDFHVTLEGGYMWMRRLPLQLVLIFLKIYPQPP